MALIIADRVKETTTTTGTGNISLSGATFGGFQTFAEAIGDGNITYYCIQNDSQFEIGIGTYTASTNSLSRDTIFQSSNSDNKINIDGIGIVFSVVPADRLVYKDADDAVVFPTPFAFKRSDSGDYWQAYSTDYTNRVSSFFIEEGTDPTWKIGLKTSASQIVAPYYAYISAKDGFIELRGNANSILSIGDEDAQGLQVNHQLKNIIDIRKNGGEIAIQNLDLNSDETTKAKNNSIAYTVFAVESSAAHASDLQTWSVATDEKASLNQHGDLETVGNIIAPSGRFTAVRFSDGSIQTTAALPLASGALIDQNATDIVAQSGYFQSTIDLIDNTAVSGWAEGYIDEISGVLQPQINTNKNDIATVSGLLYDDSAVSGYFESRVDSADSSIAANSGYFESRVDSADSNITANSGYFESRVDSADSSITANSGYFESRVDSADLGINTVSGLLTPSGESFGFAGNVLTYNNSNGGSFNADLSSLSTFDTSGVSLSYSAGTLTYTNNAGGSFDVDISSISGDVYALIVDGAPATLDTLNEIAAALNDDANIATTLTSLISTTSGNLQTQITSNDGDITQLNSDIATVSGLLYDDSAVSGYFESRVDAADSNISTNSSSITANSGYFESRVDSADSIITANSGYFESRVDSADTNISTNSSSITANSGYFESRVDSADSNISVVSGLIPPTTFSITGGDGSNYTIDGMGLNSAYDPTIYMHKGQTYTFNKTFSGHPFRVSTTDGGSVYSDADGTAIEIGSAAGSVTFEIPQDAPDKLYYYCTAHASSMKGVIYTTTNGSLSGYFESRVDSADTNISTNSSSITANSGYFESRVDQADTDIATVSGLLYDDSAVSGYFESRVDANTADIATVSGIAGLTIRDIDGTPSISNVTTIRVTNGSLTDNGGGTVTIATSGSGGGSSYDDAAISGYFESRVDSADSTITANSGYFESRVDSADSTATAHSGYFESRVDANAADIVTVSGLTGGSSSLTVRDIDGTPSVSNVTTIEVTNGSLTDQGGGVVRIATSGSGGGGGGASSTGVPSGVGFFDDSGSLSGNNTFIYDGSDVKVSGRIFASGEQVITSDEIFHIKQLTQAEYDLITPDSATFYIITDVGSSPSIQSYREVSSDTTLLSTDYTINATTSLVLTLPTAVGNEGLLYNIKNTGTGNVIVSGVSSQTIDNQPSFEISTQYQSIKLQSTNSNWIIL